MSQIKAADRDLATMNDLMKYSWGPVTNEYLNFKRNCRLLEPDVKDGLCDHYDYDGYTYTEDFLRGYYELRDFKARKDDVFIVSFPKTGTTWLQEIIYVMFYGCENAKALPVDRRVPFLEIFPGGKSGLESYHSPRLLKTHFGYSALPASAKQKKCKMIYITRNPKDTITSMYHFYRSVKSFQFKGNLEEFTDMFINDQVMSAPYSTHVLDFWDRRHEDHILFLTYERLQKNFQGEIRSIAEFLGKNLSDERVAEIAQHCSFDQMAANPATNYSHRDNLGWRNLNETKFMRKGQVGDWVNHFSPTTNQKVEDWMRQNFSNTQLKFDFHN